MNIKHIKSGGLARIDSSAVINSSNDMTELQYRTLFVIISHINHNVIKNKNQKIIVEIDFSSFIKEIATFGINWKKSKMQFRKFMKDLQKSQLTFISNVVVDGVTLDATYSYFSSIVPVSENGVVKYKFTFTDEVKPLVTNLKKSFTRLYSRDIARLKGKYTIDIFAYFNAIRGKQMQYMDVVIKNIQLNVLRDKLGLDSNNYRTIKSLKKDLLDKAIAQINEHTPILVWYTNIKEGKKIVAFKFHIAENANYNPNNKKASQEEIESLLYFEYKAFHILTKFGVTEGIILKQIIPTLPKGHLQGKEDIFIQYVLNHFNSNTKLKTLKQKVGAFVNWYCRNKVYQNQESNIFISIREKVIQYTKDKASKDPAYFQNWFDIKDKTYAEVYGSSPEFKF